MALPSVPSISSLTPSSSRLNFRFDSAPVVDTESPDVESGFGLFEGERTPDSKRISTSMYSTSREYIRRPSVTASAQMSTAMYPETADTRRRRQSVSSMKIGSITHVMSEVTVEEMLHSVDRNLRPSSGMQPLQITLVRHGETDDNRRHVLQGQIPTALNAAGIAQGELCAKRISKEVKDVDFIISSDLPRARETAELIQKEYPRPLTIELTELLRERSLGVFEGQKVDDVKDKVGDLYKKFREPRMPYVLDWLALNHPDTKVESLAAMITRTKKAIQRVLNLGAEIARKNYIPYSRSEHDDGDECEHTSAKQPPPPPHIIVVGHGMILRCFMSILLANRNLHPKSPQEAKEFFSCSTYDSFAWLGCTFSNTCINKITISIQPLGVFEKADEERYPFFGNPQLMKVNDIRHLAKMDVVKPKTAE